MSATAEEDEHERVDRSERLLEFFDDYEQTFDSPEKKALFIEGYLGMKLANTQYRAGKKTPPFQKTLRQTRITADNSRMLFDDICSKLDEYDGVVDYDCKYSNVREMASEFFVEAENNGWEIGRDEAGYFFQLGYNMVNSIEGDKND